MVSSNGGTALTVVETPRAMALTSSVQINGLDEVWRLSETLARCDGFVPAAYLGKPNNIAAAILTGIELQMGPMESLREINIVKGRPTLSSGCMLARSIRSGARVEWLESTDKAAKLRLSRGGISYEQGFTIEQAKTAGLLSKDGPWHTYPGAMLRARCISAAVRAFCPDVIGGGGLYTPEEASDMQPAKAPGSSGSPEVVDLGAALHETDAAPEGEDPLALVMYPLSMCKTPGDLGVWLRKYSAQIEQEHDTQRKRDRWKTIGKTAGALVPPVRKAELVEMFRKAREQRAPVERDPLDELPSVETGEMLEAWALDHLAWLRTLSNEHRAWGDIQATAKRIDAPNAANAIDVLVNGEVG